MVIIKSASSKRGRYFLSVVKTNSFRQLHCDYIQEQMQHFRNGFFMVYQHVSYVTIGTVISAL